MPRIVFSNVDVFAFLDADSAEAKGFRTYLGYVTAIDTLVRDNWPSLDFSDLQRVLEPELRRMRGKRYNGPVAPVQSLLVNGWLTELHLHTVNHHDSGIIRIANHMAPMYSYYATTRSASAYLTVQTGSAPTTHAAVLKQLAKLIEGNPRRFPDPWNLRCTSLTPSIGYASFPTHPARCSNLSQAANPYDAVAMALRTTRKRQLDKLVAASKQQLKVSRAPKGESARRDKALEPTNLFDFLWRVRTRSNYGDPAMFFMGALGASDVLGYHQALRRITAGTCFLFEAFLCQRAPQLVMDAATHFISRDRSRLSDQILLPRLAALGLVPKLRNRATSP